MQHIPLMQSGDGYMRADNGSLGRTLAKTANYTIRNNEERKLFSNAGAAGAVVFTLPAAKDGKVLTFYKATPGQNLTLQCPAGAKINGGTVAKAFENTTSETGTVTIFSDGTDWFVMGYRGTWANNNT